MLGGAGGFLSLLNHQEALSPGLLHHVLVLLDLGLAPAGSAFGADGPDGAASGEGVLDEAQTAAPQGVGDVADLNAEAHVGLVGAEAIQGLLEAQAGERLVQDGLAAELFGDGDEEALDDVEDVLLLGEGHLQVQLIELAGAAVGPGVLVPEARGDLVVAVEAGDP